MSWISLALLAAFIWAFVDVLDKYFVTKLSKNPYIPVMILAPVDFVASMAIFFIHGFEVMSPQFVLLGLLSGTFRVLMVYWYFRAAKIEEISRVSPLFYISPFFLLLLAGIFLGEIFTLSQYVGILFLVLGAFFISEKKPFSFRVGPAFWYMIFSAFCLSISQIIIKYLLGFSDFWTVFAYTEFGVFLSILPIFYLHFGDLRRLFQREGVQPFRIMAISEGFNLVAVFLSIVAASVGPITLVNAISAVQPFFLLVFTIFLSIFSPKILHEKIGGKIVLFKVFSMGLMFLGVVLFR
ncbi:DMT family transporter [Candidatus Peregrinibacteria bacterium]|nr:DMT family transporter [Candidatus Peregrinibacteria bacterium]